MNLKEAFEHLKANYQPEDVADTDTVMLGFAHEPSDTDPSFFMVELLYKPQQHRTNTEGFYADYKFSDLPETSTTTTRCLTCNTVEELLLCLPDFAANLNYQAYELEEPAFDADFEDTIAEVFPALSGCKKANFEKQSIQAIKKLNTTK